jgi:hypothetical protein
MYKLLKVSIILLIPTLGLSSCKPKEELKVQSKKIIDFLNKKSPEIKTEENKDKAFNLVLSQVSKEDLEKEVNDMSKDEEVDEEYEPMSSYELSLKRQGFECVKCNANAEDPNMRFK